MVAAEGGPLAGWKVEGGPAARAAAGAGRGSAALHGQAARQKRQRFHQPAAAAPQGSRRTLQLVAAQLRGDGLLDLIEPGSARAATDAEKEGFTVAGQLRVYALADAARPPRFEAVWAEGTEVLAAQIDRLLVDVAAGTGGRAAYQLWAEVRNRGTLSLEVVLPPGFELIDADRDGEKVLPGKSARGGFEVPLFAGEETQVVHLRGLLPLALPAVKTGELALVLPALSAPAARVEVRLLLPAVSAPSWPTAAGRRPPGRRRARRRATCGGPTCSSRT